MKRASMVLLVLLGACTPPAPAKAKVTMKLTFGMSGGEAASAVMNGKPLGPTPQDLDALALAFDPALKPASWPPPGASAFSPTVAQHGKQESSLALAVLGDIVYVQTRVHGAETVGGFRMTLKAADGASLEFDTAEKSLSSGLGRADHSVRLWYRKGK